MAKYTFECSMGHSPATLEVEADNDEAAMSMMMSKAKDHLAQMHTGGPAMSDDQIKEMITKGWQKS